jgi:hypothetical protein
LAGQLIVSSQLHTMHDLFDMHVRLDRHNRFASKIACSLGLSATSQQYFSLRTNQPLQPAATSQQYSSLRTNQHQPSVTSQPNKLVPIDKNLRRRMTHARGLLSLDNCARRIWLAKSFILCGATSLYVKRKPRTPNH